MRRQQARIVELEADNARLERRLQRLESLLTDMAAKSP